MSNQRLPLNINVGFFYNLPIGSHRDIHFEFPTLHFPPDLDVNDFKGMVHISRTPQGLLFEGKFKAAAAAECVRCLESCTQDLEFEINEVYAYKSHFFTDSNLYVPEDGNIDLSPILREYLLLEIPIKPLCRDDCQGLCTICGVNLNEVSCEHHARIITD
ncbi:MAG: DUF177 domain-containing protein [Anaerolineaceae bacterium]|nr:DUF177 domain-containing protein [Anaerolineaceae bacterium]